MTNVGQIPAADGIETVYRIGELAAEFDVTLRALRFYEDKNLLQPRRVGNTRFYSRRDRARLALILMGKRLGFSLQDIAEILALYDPADGNRRQLRLAAEKGGEQLERLHRERADIDAAIGELQTMLTDIERQLSAADAR
ncbi:MAG: MerR family DNA-binding transcriptional regulator [Roseitalea sp.]|jgi:DNA-binding transcriptional MerR regulator|nr:MerR family DNA-binding transcriptional regulator [Roseitalea sp.]MBO6722470.1 MerR family DNA-binding transcriptional regulator [Roseitalea sp.]MBO6742986.1 MerR family DNA-binding transcriptional regulator [Roseitalea sp.]